MGFPAQAGLGSVPSPGWKGGTGIAVGAEGGEGRWQGRAGGTPRPRVALGAESAGASARAKRVRSGPGWDVQCE